MDKAYDPKIVEKKWYSFWEEHELFTAKNSKKPPYAIVIPPPNVTGVLHMGHALVDTLQDILIRWKRMLGFDALWVPGTDHAGIATQTVVERNLFLKEGKRRQEVGREAFLEMVWEWKEACEGQILSQIKSLGCSCDWSRLRFTMDEQCNKAVFTAFKKLFDDGLIYQGDYLVNWDPVAQTALSDDEVEHEERDSFLWHIRYGDLVVATTRPETMLGDTAVAVNPKDPRYQKWIGKKIKLPLTEREIPVVADPFVEPEFGTGVVKITPAHDFNDFEMGQRHALPRINIMTPDGKILEGRYAGQTMEQARESVLADLGPLVVKKEPHKLRVGVSYRSKAVIQPYLSKQWFINMGHFKPKLISAVKEKRVKLIPPHWEETYFHWIENLRDWCISRQLWWGHRIPVWHKGKEKVCSESSPGEGWVQDPDVLDTWFSSALWPLSTLGWPDKTEDFTHFYPTATLITGHDILFFWVARMIMMGEYFTGKVPFYETFLHGLIYGKSYWKESPNGVVYVSKEDKRRYDLGEPLAKGVESKWEKMSKSKGNIIDPIEIIEEYGADAIRFALTASVTHARQIDLDRRRFEEYKNFANKFWNGARFVFMNLEEFEPAKGLNMQRLQLEDRWILSLLNQTIADVNKHLEEYIFNAAATRVYEFFWNDFCANYLEIAKPILFGKIGDGELKSNKQQILVVVLCNVLRLMHPIAPFITEEIFAALRDLQMKGGVDPYTRESAIALASPACIVAPYPKPHMTIDEESLQAFDKVLEWVRQIRNIRAEMGLAPSEKTEAIVVGKKGLAEEEIRIILALTPTTQIHFVENEPKAFGASSLIGPYKLIIPLSKALQEKEMLRLEKEKEKLGKKLETTLHQLANGEFRARAPKELVEKLELAKLQTEKQLAEIQDKLLNFRS